MIKHKQNPENVKILSKKHIFVKIGEQGEHSRAVQELKQEIKNFVLHVFIPFYLFFTFLRDLSPHLQHIDQKF